jgi:hypothetical protein
MQADPHKPAESTDRTPITASLYELARRVRTDLLRHGGIDWQDDPATAGGTIDEPAVIAAWVVLGRLAQERGRLRVARQAFMLAELQLCMSCRYGRFRPKPEPIDQMPPWWRQSFVPIIRQRAEYEETVRPGDYFVRHVGAELKLFRRQP